MEKITDFTLVDFFVPDGVTLPNNAEQELMERGYTYQTGTMGGRHGTMWRKIPRYFVFEWLQSAQQSEFML